MKISPKVAVACSLPPASAAVAGGVLLNGGTNKNEPVVDNNPVPISQPLQPARVIRPITQRNPVRTPPAPTVDTPKPKPTYSKSIYSDPNVINDNNRSKNNVLQSNSANFLLNADPAFDSDASFIQFWTKKWDYLKQQENNKLAKETVFKDALVSYLKLSSTCRTAYTGSHSIISSGIKNYWSHPDSTIKESNKLETYWQAIWHFCTDPNMNTSFLTRIPETWGGTKVKN